MPASVRALGAAARSASRSQATASTEREERGARVTPLKRLEGGVDGCFLPESGRPCEAERQGNTGALLDRLILNQGRIEGMASGFVKWPPNPTRSVR